MALSACQCPAHDAGAACAGESFSQTPSTSPARHPKHLLFYSTLISVSELHICCFFDLYTLFTYTAESNPVHYPP